MLISKLCPRSDVTTGGGITPKLLKKRKLEENQTPPPEQLTAYLFCRLLPAGSITKSIVLSNFPALHFWKAPCVSKSVHWKYIYLKNVCKRYTLGEYICCIITLRAPLFIFSALSQMVQTVLPLKSNMPPTSKHASNIQDSS